MQRGHDAGGLGDMWGTANTAAEVSGAFLNKFVVNFYRGLGDWIVNTYKRLTRLQGKSRSMGSLQSVCKLAGRHGPRYARRTCGDHKLRNSS